MILIPSLLVSWSFSIYTGYNNHNTETVIYEYINVDCMTLYIMISRFILLVSYSFTIYTGYDKQNTETVTNTNKNVDWMTFLWHLVNVGLILFIYISIEIGIWSAQILRPLFSSDPKMNVISECVKYLSHLTIKFTLRFLFSFIIKRVKYSI